MTNKHSKHIQECKKTKTYKKKNKNVKKKTYLNLKVDAHAFYAPPPGKISKGEVPSRRVSLKLKVGKQEGRQVGVWYLNQGVEASRW
jgi:hypothetical protein